MLESGSLRLGGKTAPLNPKPKKGITLWPLIAATYFMVSGGPYGLEDVVRGAGYGGAILLLLVTPLIWSLPTALMIGELSSAIPAEGGYYVWVRRAAGSFWDSRKLGYHWRPASSTWPSIQRCL